jgi:hypothetical protein
LPDARVFLSNQAVKIFAGKMRFRAQEDVKDQVALRGTLQSLLLNMLEKNFLLFSHLLGDLQSRFLIALSELFYTPRGSL